MSWIIDSIILWSVYSAISIAIILVSGYAINGDSLLVFRRETWRKQE